MHTQGSASQEYPTQPDSGLLSAWRFLEDIRDESGSGPKAQAIRSKSFVSNRNWQTGDNEIIVEPSRLCSFSPSEATVASCGLPLKDPKP